MRPVMRSDASARQPQLLATTRRVGRTMGAMGIGSPATACRNMRAAVAASSRIGCRTVVNGRSHERCHGHVVETSDGDITGHRVSAGQRTHQHTEGDLVVGADDALGRGIATLDETLHGDDAVVLLHRDPQGPARCGQSELPVGGPEASPALGHVG